MKTASSKELEDFVATLSENARTDLIPKMKASRFCLAMMDEHADLYLALQIGLALVLDKPLFLVVAPGAWVAPRLRQMAEAIIEGSFRDPATKSKFETAIMAFMKKGTPQ
jgi:hypothetical protein